VTSYGYDADGENTSESDPDGNTTYDSYDSYGRLASQSETVALYLSGDTQVTTAATTTYQYDADGDLLQETDPELQVTLYAHDHLNRQTGEQWYSSASTAAEGPTYASNVIAYTYDLDGDLLTAADDYSSYTYAYDSFGQQVSVDNNGSGIGGSSGTPNVPDVKLNSTYDAVGNRTSLSATIGGTADFVNTYSYDDLDREKQVLQGESTASGHDTVDSKLVNFTYFADGQFETIDRYNALTDSSGVANSSYGYDDAGRITGLTHTEAGTSTTYAAYTWTYNNDSQVTSFTNAANIGGTDSTYADENVQTYSYDADGQLTGAVQPGGQSPNAANSLTNSYDASGNLVNSESTIVGAGNVVLYDGTYTYTYNADGDVTAKIGTSIKYTYSYDNRNRLTQVAIYTGSAGDWTESQTIGYTYDMFDNLIGRTVTNYSSGSPTGSTSQYYVFDGVNMVLAFNSSDALTDRYLWGPAVDQLLADESSAAGTTLWELGDNQNTIRDVVSDSGTLEQHLAYNPFGQQVASLSYASSGLAAAADAVFGYTGTYTDPITGLQLHGVRWYDPGSQRWLTPDPAAADENLYRYCVNAPTDATDPSGLWPIILGPGVPLGEWTHETMSHDAAKDAGWQVSEVSGELAGETEFVQGVEGGVASVDDPEGLIALNSVREFGNGQTSRADAFKNAPESMRTHYGDLSFQHGMTPHDEAGNKLDWDANKMQTKIVEWIIERYNAARSKPEGSSAQGYAIGQALHTIEDLYSPAHVERDATTGAITQFQDYNAQDPCKHKDGDDGRKHKIEWDKAKAAATQLLRFLKDGASSERVRQWLLKEGPVTIAPGATNGDTAEQYKPSPPAAPPRDPAKELEGAYQQELSNQYKHWGTGNGIF
jgi:RHS repeat-associated protein